MRQATDLGHLIMEAVALSLDLPRDHFRKLYTEIPFTPFRLFHYPKDEVVWIFAILFTLADP